MFKAGDVIRIFDRETERPQHKRHICICIQRRLLLRINTDSYWKPRHRILLKDNPVILDYDSWVELRQLYKAPVSDWQDAQRRADNPLGRLSPMEATKIAVAARAAATISEEYQDVIWQALANLS